MKPSHVSPLPTERQALDAGVVRTGVLALIALIVGLMFTYEVVGFSPSTPLPRPRPSAVGTAPVVTTDPVGQFPSDHAQMPRNPSE
jgi:hypothetical protein